MYRSDFSKRKVTRVDLWLPAKDPHISRVTTCEVLDFSEYDMTKRQEVYKVYYCHQESVYNNATCSRPVAGKDRTYKY